MYHQRALEQGLAEASEQFPVILVTGPRQVGKTTLLKHMRMRDRRYVSLDDLTLRALANDDPNLFLQRYRPPVLIDEIQYAPALFPAIKVDVDSRRKPGAYWLTGSQHFRLMKGITESLAGRVAILNLLGFSHRERDRRDLTVSPFLPTEEQVLARAGSAARTSIAAIFGEIWKGSFPALLAGEISDWELFYSSYLQTYVERDIRDLAQVGDQTRFMRFLKACAARTGQMLNYSDLARDSDISVPTAKDWLSVLEASYQIHLVQPYHSNLTKRLVKAPKLYFMDSGFCAYLTDWKSPETLSSGAMAGAMFETWVLGELLKSWWHRMRNPNLYYYRDKDGREIDFLFCHDNRFYPVEAKLGATPRRGWIRVFGTLERLELARDAGAVVCLCEDTYPLDSSTTALPVGYL
jgi:predicted AAA+ superfamily ATPase